ncbi:flagellar filament capping protein FliD [Duganella sp. FT50W]|uniref:Flagellar hook-associated protein 2 n=1 Tax=Duganella lactea TaxID=2692173 RepID=A0A6L8MR07_9BURK|nr:flagellar filament capping protein FliD [Duganella lactea]MYM83938.1 flagellar filament capping protein FliD [Duganella lactea]
MAVITSPTYDPKTTAENLANSYVASRKAILDQQTAAATATATGLSKLGSALSAFQSTLASLASGSSSVTATKAAFSNTAIGNASASAAAQAGSYAFYVQQLATSGQVSYNVADSAATGGSMKIVLANGAEFDVDLSSADTNKDNTLSAKEIAAAINASATNKSQITASTMTIGNQTRLVLTSNATGEGNIVQSVQTTGVDPALDSAMADANQTVLAVANDAIVRIGSKTGTEVKQASNTFSIVDDVKFTITQAQGANDAPVTLTISPDNSGTAANVQKFVDAYNALLGSIKTLTAAGDHSLTSATGTSTATPDAAFYNDAGVLSLRDRLNSILRDASGGQSLISYGISATKDGTLTLNADRLNKAIAANPDGLDKLFGRSGIGVDSGVLGAMNKQTTLWTSGVGGLITQRRTQNDRLQSDLSNRQTTVQNQFDNAYKRYLAQFTALQQLQSTMTNTSNMFTAMFASNSSS